MSIDGKFLLSMTMRETLETNVDGASSPRITHDKFNKSERISASTTPPGTKMVADTKALVAGAATIDLTALPGPGGGTIDATDLKLLAWFFGNRAGNTGDLTITPGAASPYNFNGSATGKVVAVKPNSADENPGWAAAWNGNNATIPDVAAGAKNIDVAGFGTESFDYVLVFG